jgi:transcriptional regulator with PAS, ATPase and Fis domain
MNKREIISKAWHDFFVLGNDEVTGVNDLIKESWRRSRINKIDYENQYIIEGDEERRKSLIESNYFLIDIARPYMDDLYGIISDTNYMITILERDGFVIDTLVNPAIRRKSDLRLVNYREDRIGTNAMGTCLYLNKPVLTFGEEHCYKNLHKFTTSAAPIHDAEGELIGCIGITGFSDNVSTHTLGMAIATAYAIENKIKLHLDKKSGFIQEYTSILKDSISDGVIIADIKGNVLSVNKKAENMLNIKEKDFLNRNIKEVLDNNIDFNKEFDKNIDYIIKNTVLTVKNNPLHLSLSITKLKTDSKGTGFLIMLNNAGKKINDCSGKTELYSFEDILGESVLIKDAIEIGKIASRGNSNVLILGESGTGKELFAQSIHRNSPRKDKPFIDINCGALPVSLAESEFFGYEGGSYTGSKKEGQPGKFELADGGTIFLDEIGELPLSIQASLLRVIQERKVIRIGSSQKRDIDVMIIAATNKDLFEAVRCNTFRKDLFYRLNVFTINLPPLMEHKEDIPILVNNLIERYNQMFGLSIKGVSDEVMNIFMRYNWPGNIRELENIIQRAVQISKYEMIQTRDLPIYLTSGFDLNKIKSSNITSLIDAQESSTIINVLKKTNGNAKLTSEVLGISRSTLYRKLLKLGYKIDEFRN